MDELEQKTAELLENCRTLTLASVTSAGYPRPCVVAKLAVEDGFRRIFVATGTSSRKTRQFAANPKAGVAFGIGRDAVTLIGTVRALNPDEKARYWRDWLASHFAGGVDDPEYCVLEFSTEEAVLCVDGAFETRNYRG